MIMNTYAFLLAIFMIFMIVSEMIFVKLGFDPENMDIISILLVWIVLIGVPYWCVKIIFRVSRKYRRS